MLNLKVISGLATNSNVVTDDQVSGVMGLGFPRLSVISALVVNGKRHQFSYFMQRCDFFTTATPFFTSLAQQGQLDYPLCGLSLTMNSTGTLAIGSFTYFVFAYEV